MSLSRLEKWYLTGGKAGVACSNQAFAAMSKEFVTQMKEIIYDHLGRHASKFFGNRSVVCATRLLNLLNITSFNDTIELATFIENSWTDLECTDEQVDSIIAETIRIMKGENVTFVKTTAFVRSFPSPPKPPKDRKITEGKQPQKPEGIY